MNNSIKIPLKVHSISLKSIKYVCFTRDWIPSDVTMSHPESDAMHRENWWGSMAAVLVCKSDWYPLVNVYITMERSTIFHGKIHFFYGYFPVRKLLVYRFKHVFQPYDPMWDNNPNSYSWDVFGLLWNSLDGLKPPISYLLILYPSISTVWYALGLAVLRITGCKFHAAQRRLRQKCRGEPW